MHLVVYIKNSRTVQSTALVCPYVLETLHRSGWRKWSSSCYVLFSGTLTTGNYSPSSVPPVHTHTHDLVLFPIYTMKLTHFF